jgi:uncharacterized protein involved in exopolysaccharide biosynthesis
MEAGIEYTASDYFNAFKRRRGILVIVAVPILLLSVSLSMLLPDKYTSSAQIDINLEGTSARTLEPIEVTTYADQYIAKLTDRALSTDNLRRLAEDPEIFAGAHGELVESDRLGLLRESIEVSVLTQSVISPNSGREVDLISGVRVAAVGADPQFVYAVADRASDLFLEADRLSRTERASSASLFLSDQMSLREQEILDLEQQIADFKVGNSCCLPELVALNTSVIDRAERDIEDIRPRIRSLEQDRVFLQSQLEEIKQLAGATDRLAELEEQYMTLVANYGSNHPDVVRLRREITAMASADASGEGAYEMVELRMKLIEAEQKYSSEHPDVIRYRQQLAALEAKSRSGVSSDQAKLLENPRYIQVRAELNSIETELAELRAREPDLREKIREYEDRLAKTPQVESEYQALTRRLESAQESFNDLQQRAVIAQQSAALESTDIGARLTEIVPPVIPREPSGPPRTAIVILGVFLAGTLGIGSMLLAEMTDATIRGGKDVARVVNMVPLATVPTIENAKSKRVRRRNAFLVRGTLIVVTIGLVFFIFKDML